MPNHIHFIWRPNKLNGKEMPHASFLKFTAHEFKKLLLQGGGISLEAYKAQANNKEYEFWQRDSLAVHLYTREVAFQKLDYLHNNPLAEHWQLAVAPADYIILPQGIMKKKKEITLSLKIYSFNGSWRHEPRRG
jgi:REP element-mobilizing transposase RayT